MVAQATILRQWSLQYGHYVLGLTLGGGCAIHTRGTCHNLHQSQWCMTLLLQFKKIHRARDHKLKDSCMLFALQRVLGRLKRAEQSRNRGNTMKYQQSRSWLVSCIVHYNGSRPGEQDRLQRLIDELFDGMSDDEDSPTHGDPAEVRTFRICAASEKLHHHLRLLEMDLSENYRDPQAPWRSILREGPHG